MKFPLKSFPVLLIILLGFHSVQAQSNVSNPIRVKGVEDLARDRDPDLFLPKDEFETRAEYQQRLTRQKELITQVRKEIAAKAEARAAEARRERERRAAEARRERERKIAASREPVEIRPSSLGKYNADQETFPLTVNGKTYTVEIPRSAARSFKQNFKSVNVVGYKQLRDDLQTWEYFNLAAVNPLTGARYSFGPVKDLKALPAPVARKVIIPPDLVMRVAFKETNGDGFLDAEEQGAIRVSITNRGEGSALGVSVTLKALAKYPGVHFESSKTMGEIPPGQSKTVTLNISADKDVGRRENSFTISATENYGFPPDDAALTFETFPFIPPKLELVDYGISTATGDNVIQPGVTVEVQARVQNRGQGAAEKTAFSILLPQGVYFTPESKQEYSFASLKPGEFKDLEFSFVPSKKVGKFIDLTISYREASASGRFPLKLAVEKPQKTIQQLVVKGRELNQAEITDVATISVDIEKELPKTRRRRGDDLAVVFGIEAYKNVPGVSFAKRDALWMKKYFENALGIPADHIYYRTDSDVGQAEFSKVFSPGGWLDKRIKDGESNIFIYYAGHGAPDMKQNQAYLIPYDGDPNYASQTGYGLEGLYANLADLKAASVTVFLDACFSGANRDNEMLLADARPVFIQVAAPAVQNVTVFSAAGGREISSAWPEKKHGLFSYYLMKGMGGAADADGDRKITIGELGDYIKENVSATAGMLDREQTPELRTMDREKVLIQY